MFIIIILLLQKFDIWLYRICELPLEYENPHELIPTWSSLCQSIDLSITMLCHGSQSFLETPKFRRRHSLEVYPPEAELKAEFHQQSWPTKQTGFFKTMFSGEKKLFWPVLKRKKNLMSKLHLELYSNVKMNLF